MGAKTPTLIGARSFDSRWRWTKSRDASPVLPARFRTGGDLSTAIGEAIRQSAAADFAMIGSYRLAPVTPVALGIARVADVTPIFYFVSIGECDMAGAEIAEVRTRFEAAGGLPVLFCPSRPIAAPGVEVAKTYRVAFPTDLLWRFSAVVKTAPRNYSLTSLQVADALDHFLATE
jgi:hypothetical protein